MKRISIAILFVSVFSVVLPGTILAQPSEQPSVFDLPQLQRLQLAARQSAARLMQAGEMDKAETLLQRAIVRLPHDASMHYNLACVQARLGKRALALSNLGTAIDKGFRDVKHIKADDDLKSLRDMEKFKSLLERAADPNTPKPKGWQYKVEPATISDGEVIVSEKNTAFVPQVGMLHAVFKLDAEATKGKPIAAGMGEVGKLLIKWQEEGAAAGNHGDLYDNHDNEHSNMNYNWFPQLTRIEFDDVAKKRGLHNGLQRHLFYNAVTIGNSSTALTRGPFWRCQGRYALTQPGGANILYLHYTRNHLYFYPEHRDHDPGHNNKDGKGFGDVFPANTPYLFISQGSSGSDRAFMNAVTATLAAFRPDVKQALAKQGLIAPTVQMILRMSNKQVEKREDYLAGKAHPTVFDGKQINAMKMIKRAHAISVEKLPPMVQLKVVEEDEPVLGLDYFDIAPRERFLDTPCAIGRVVKGSQFMRRMVVSAEGSLDVNKLPLKFHWKVLRGDAERIQIKKLNEAGSVVELLVPYHERRPIQPGSDMASNRVDIGVFVDNGHHYSAPGFVSFFYLDNENRRYDEQGRIRMIDYTDPQKRNNYVDPWVDMKKDWRDEYLYGDDGKMAGWKRLRGEQIQQFTAEGRLVIKSDDSGKPIKTAAVRYVAKHEAQKAPVLIQQTIGE